MSDKQRYMLNADVAIEVYAEDEDEAREVAERFIEGAVGYDPLVYSAAVTSFIWGPEVVEDDE